MSDEEVIEQAPEVEEGTPEVDETEAEREKIRAEVEAEFAKKEKALQKGFQEIADRERAISSPPPVDDDVPELDETAAKALKKFIETEYGAQLGQSTAVMNSLAERELQKFASDKEVDADEIRALIEDYGLVKKPGLDGVEDALNKAYNLQRALNFDPKAEAEKLREQSIAEAEEGVRVEGVKPKRGASPVSSNEDVHEMSTADRLAYYKEHYPDLYQ
jgi:hypothetical protein